MLVFLIVIIILAIILERYSLKHALDRVSYDTMPSKSIVEIGEEFTILSVLSNRKRMIVPFLMMKENLPDIIELKGKNLNIKKSAIGADFTSTVYLMPYQRLTRSVTVVMNKRGRYTIGSTVLFGGDFLGLSSTIQYHDLHKEIVVLPKRAESVALGRLLGSFIGDISTNRFIIEDPVLTVGFRDYTGREPLKDVSWTQTAKAGKLMVKKYDFTLDLMAVVILNTEIKNSLDFSEENLEYCFSVTRTICEYLEKKAINYSFITNSVLVGAALSSATVAKGLGQNHLMAVLEALGRASYYSFEPFETTAKKTLKFNEHGTTYIVITPNRAGIEKPIQYLKSVSNARVLVITPDAAKEEAV